MNSTPTPEQRPDQREFTPVAPPHPYAQGAQQQTGKGLAISAMGTGLLAVFTAVVAVFYRGFFSFGAVVLGLAAIALGIAALVTRSRAKGSAIAGLASGGVAVVIPLVLTVLMSVSAVFGGSFAPSADASSEGGTAWDPSAEQEALTEWPANMATGGILFSGPGDPRPVESEPLPAATAPIARELDRETKNDLLIYVDYQCPHCMMFEQTNGELLERAMSDGVTTVELVPLSFMDRGDSSGHSTRAAGAVMCLADSQPEAAWAAHRALLTPEVQRQAAGMNDDALIRVLDEATGGLNAEAQQCISTGRFTSFAGQLNNWVFANPVPNANDSESRLSGTPSVFVNGEFYTGASDDGAAFEAFFKEHTN